jgi:hypothetical protein
MNYNDKKNDDLEMDELNIKSHLNTSLDLSGISVSEDLINRTLAAIKEQPVENKDPKSGSEELGKKIIPWGRYVRGFAGVAAAVLIVAVGYNVIKQEPFGSQKNNASTGTELQEKTMVGTISEEETNQNFSASSTEDAATSETASEDAKEDANDNSAEIAATDVTEEEAAIQYTITADTFTKDAKIGASGMEGEAGSLAEEAGSTDPAEPKLSASLRNSNGAALFSFREIFLPDPTTAEYITITNEANQTSITLTEQVEILDFYTVMDTHQFTSGVENTANQNYTVELKSPEPEALYTLFVGDNLTVRYLEGDVVVENSYDAVDKVLLKQNLDELYQKYSE